MDSHVEWMTIGTWIRMVFSFNISNCHANFKWFVCLRVFFFEIHFPEKCFWSKRYTNRENKKWQKLLIDLAKKKRKKTAKTFVTFTPTTSSLIKKGVSNRLTYQMTSEKKFISGHGLYSNSNLFIKKNFIHIRFFFQINQLINQTNKKNHN